MQFSRLEGLALVAQLVRDLGSSSSESSYSMGGQDDIYPFFIYLQVVPLTSEAQ